MTILKIGNETLQAGEKGLFGTDNLVRAFKFLKSVSAELKADFEDMHLNIREIMRLFDDARELSELVKIWQQIINEAMDLTHSEAQKVADLVFSDETAADKLEMFAWLIQLFERIWAVAETLAQGKKYLPNRK
jgi:hypothetical protein